MISRRGVAAAAAALAVIAGALFLTSGPDAGRDRPWNVVVIVTDDQPSDSIPTEPPVMPYLQAASSDPGDHWIAFSNFFANTPLCCPSRATMLTGRYAHEHGVLTNDDGALLDERTTVAAWLHAAGYHTGLVGKYLNGYPFGREPFVPQGWDRWWGKAQGPADSLYYDYTLVQQGIPVTYGNAEEAYATDVFAAKAVEFLREAPPDRPFFLWFATTAPHPPWVSAPRHEGQDAELALTIPESVDELDVSDKPAWVRALPPLGPDARSGSLEARRRSFETLLAVDDAVRAVVEALRARGDLDRTVIVFVSDNGLSFGEHRWSKKSCPYDECIHVPFLVRYPPAEPRTESTVISTIDLAPTIADLAGIEPPAAVDGASLVPLLDGDAGADARLAFLEWAGDDGRVPAWWQVRTVDFAYTELVTGERELYDLRRDPDQLQNVVGDPTYAPVLVRLSGSLERFRRS